MADLYSIIDDLRRRIADLERRQRAQVRSGVIEAVDAAQGRARVRLQDSAVPFVTGWLPWQEASAGAMKTHTPPSLGQQVRLFSESGDLADAVIQGSLNSTVHARPSGAGDEYVLATVGPARVAISGGGAKAVVQVAGSTVTLEAAGIDLSAPRVTITADSVAIEGASLTHNGVNVGSTHVHGGIAPGPASTSGPK